MFITEGFNIKCLRIYFNTFPIGIVRSGLISNIIINIIRRTWISPQYLKGHQDIHSLCWWSVGFMCKLSSPAAFEVYRQLQFPFEIDMYLWKSKGRRPPSSGFPDASEENKRTKQIVKSRKKAGCSGGNRWNCEAVACMMKELFSAAGAGAEVRSLLQDSYKLMIRVRAMRLASDTSSDIYCDSFKRLHTVVYGRTVRTSSTCCCSLTKKMIIVSFKYSDT